MDTATMKAIAKAAFPSYRWRKFQLHNTGRVTFCDTNWGGGSRNYYAAVRIVDGQVQPMPAYTPWANPVEGRTIYIPAGFAVVEHTIFCGKDCGLRVYLGVQHDADLIQTGRGEVHRFTMLTAHEAAARDRHRVIERGRFA